MFIEIVFVYLLCNQKLMQRELYKIATIFTGQTFRFKVENDPDGTVWVIQMKDLNNSNSGISGIPHLISSSEVSEKQILQKGDVLFLAKGNNNSAFVYDLDHPAVIVSVFFVIRLKDKQVSPYYLAWYLNNYDSQKYFKSAREGTSISSIKIKVMEELTIKLPSIEKQEMIGKLYQLSLKENEIVKDLLNEKQILMESSLIQLL